MNEIRNYNYDQRNDIFYLHFLNDKGDSYADEQAPGVFVMKDIETDETTGLTVFFPKAKFVDQSRAMTTLGFTKELTKMNECVMAFA